jgi:hypothetical protein
VAATAAIVVELVLEWLLVSAPPWRSNHPLVLCLLLRLVVLQSATPIQDNPQMRITVPLPMRWAHTHWFRRISCCVGGCGWCHSNTCVRYPLSLLVPEGQSGNRKNVPYRSCNYNNGIRATATPRAFKGSWNVDPQIQVSRPPYYATMLLALLPMITIGDDDLT